MASARMRHSASETSPESKRLPSGVLLGSSCRTQSLAWCQLLCDAVCSKCKSACGSSWTSAAQRCYQTWQSSIGGGLGSCANLQNRRSSTARTRSRSFSHVTLAPSSWASTACKHPVGCDPACNGLQTWLAHLYELAHEPLAASRQVALNVHAHVFERELQDSHETRQLLSHLHRDAEIQKLSDAVCV